MKKTTALCLFGALLSPAIATDWISKSYNIDKNYVPVIYDNQFREFDPEISYQRSRPSTSQLVIAVLQNKMNFAASPPESFVDEEPVYGTLMEVDATIDDYDYYESQIPLKMKAFEYPPYKEAWRMQPH